MAEQQNIDRQELALLDVVRLGLSGDARSLRQKVRNLLRGGKSATLSPMARAELHRLLGAADATEPRRAMRRDIATTDPTQFRPAPVEDAEEPVLEPSLGDQLEQLVREHEARHLLEEANLAPASRVLFTGPPGTGKTMTASWIAARLGKPLFVIEPGQVISSLMGESARNLSQLLRASTLEPSVLLLDELDVYARHRGEVNDMAEPKRLVNTLLLELDHWPDHSLLIAATNHLEAIDVAVGRRFELCMTFTNPTPRSRRAIVGGVLARAHRSIDDELLDAIAEATPGQSGSTLANTTTAALRRSIIDGVGLAIAIPEQFFSSRFQGRDAAARDARSRFVQALMARGRKPGEIARLIGSKAETVEKMVGT